MQRFELGGLYTVPRILCSFESCLRVSIRPYVDTACMMKRNKYQSFTIERKLGIIDEVDSLPSGIMNIPYAGFFRGRIATSQIIA